MEEGNNEMLEQLQGKVSMLKEVHRYALFMNSRALAPFTIRLS